MKHIIVIIIFFLEHMNALIFQEKMHSINEYHSQIGLRKIE